MGFWSSRKAEATADRSSERGRGATSKEEPVPAESVPGAEGVRGGAPAGRGPDTGAGAGAGAGGAGGGAHSSTPHRQPEELRAVEEAMKRLAIKVDMIDAKTDELLMGMCVVLEQFQRQRQQQQQQQQQQQAPHVLTQHHVQQQERRWREQQQIDTALSRLSRYQNADGLGRANFYVANGAGQGLYEHSLKARDALPLAPALSAASRAL